MFDWFNLIICDPYFSARGRVIRFRQSKREAARRTGIADMGAIRRASTYMRAKGRASSNYDATSRVIFQSFVGWLPDKWKWTLKQYGLALIIPWVRYGQSGAFKFRLLFLASQVPLWRRLGRPRPSKASQPEIGKAWRNFMVQSDQPKFKSPALAMAEQHFIPNTWKTLH